MSAFEQTGSVVGAGNDGVFDSSAPSDNEPLVFRVQERSESDNSTNTNNSDVEARNEPQVPEVKEPEKPTEKPEEKPTEKPAEKRGCGKPGCPCGIAGAIPLGSLFGPVGSSLGGLAALLRALGMPEESDDSESKEEADEKPDVPSGPPHGEGCTCEPKKPAEKKKPQKPFSVEKIFIEAIMSELKNSGKFSGGGVMQLTGGAYVIMAKSTTNGEDAMILLEATQTSAKVTSASKSQCPVVKSIIDTGVKRAEDEVAARLSEFNDEHTNAHALFWHVCTQLLNQLQVPGVIEFVVENTSPVLHSVTFKNLAEGKESALGIECYPIGLAFKGSNGDKGNFAEGLTGVVALVGTIYKWVHKFSEEEALAVIGQPAKWPTLLSLLSA